MKQYFYKITFETGPSIELYATTAKEAIIIAKAEKIKAGHNGNILCCICAEKEEILQKPQLALV